MLFRLIMTFIFNGLHWSAPKSKDMTAGSTTSVALCMALQICRPPSHLLHQKFSNENWFYFSESQTLQWNVIAIWCRVTYTFVVETVVWEGPDYQILYYSTPRSHSTECQIWQSKIAAGVVVAIQMSSPHTVRYNKQSKILLFRCRHKELLYLILCPSKRLPKIVPNFYKHVFVDCSID